MTVPRLFRSTTRSPESDADLLARFVAARDEPAFAELLRRHGPVVYRVCRRLLDATLADDAFQATFLVLATRAARVRSAASVGSWLIGVAGRVARQMRRKRVLVAPDGFAATQRGASEESSHLETTELGAVLDDELTRLPDRLRAVAVACLVQQHTQQQAAAALGESERTVRRRVVEAKRLLRERLERRGVVPAVAVGLTAALGTAAAVPPLLTERTLAVVFDFLAGGAAVASAPAILAKGVAMSGYRTKVAAFVAVVALGLSALGVGLADDGPEAKTIPPTKVPVDFAPKPPNDPQPKADAAPLFVVTGGDALVNRVVQREAEHQARTLAEKWTGKPFPVPAKPYSITVKIAEGRVSGATTFTFGRESPKLSTVEMQLTCSLEQLLRVQLPHEVMHVVLAAHFGRPLPRWVDEGIAVLAEPQKEQADHDRKVREFSNAGRAIRLKHLLPMKEYPRDMIVLYAQGHSVARFLHERDPKKLFPLIEASYADGWDKALKATYGFADADALEEAWLDWLKKPETVLKAEAKLPAKAGDYMIEPPDILRLTLARKVDGVPREDDYLVRPDGTVGLGPYGSMSVTGLTVAEAAEAIRKHLATFDVDVKVSAEVKTYNSKFFYVIIDPPGDGDLVQRFPLTGNETLLEAITRAGGMPKGTNKVWIARPGAKGGKEQILPVDYKAITQLGDTKTNYQLLPGDRVFVMSK